MGKYKEVKGDLITLALNGEFDVITHGVNCFCNMGAGIAPKLAKAFNCDEYPLERQENTGFYNKLGQIDFGLHLTDSTSELEHLKSGSNLYGDNLEWAWQSIHDNEDKLKILFVVNSYTQYYYGTKNLKIGEIPLDYIALTLCLRKINSIFNGKSIGIPLIGCGLAKGDENIVLQIIKDELKDMDVTLVRYDG